MEDMLSIKNLYVKGKRCKLMKSEKFTVLFNKILYGHFKPIENVFSVSQKL
jgi:hypothetical protein